MRPVKLIFMKIKDFCCSVLVFVDFNKQFTLHTDAGGIELRAVLYQEGVEGKGVGDRFHEPILNQWESWYPMHKLEFLALKWSISTVFHDYLYSNTFTILSNNNLLTYVLT